MKLTKTDRIILILSCPAFCSVGIPLVVNSYAAGLVCIAFGFINFVLGIIGGLNHD